MINGFEDLQKLSKDNAEVAMKSLGAFTKSMQSVAAEVADYSKRSFETGQSTLEKVLAAKSVDKAVELQTQYVREAYEGYIGQMTKIGEICMGATKEAYKPFEAAVAKVTK
jgi:hypothetical protein